SSVGVAVSSRVCHCPSSQTHHVAIVRTDPISHFQLRVGYILDALAGAYPAYDAATYLVLGFHELTHNRRNLVGLGIEREMPGIENMYYRLRHIFAIALRLAGIKSQIVLAPNHQHARLFLMHPPLPLGIRVDVGA